MWILLALLCLFVLLLLVIFLPLDLIFRIDTASSPVFSARLLWTWGLIDLIKFPRERHRRKKPARKKSPHANKLEFPPGFIIQVLQVKGLPGLLLRLLRNLLHSIKIANLRLHITAGPEDPVTFAYLFAFCQPLNQMLNGIRHELSLKPVFEGQLVLACNGEGRVRVVPAVMLWHVFSALVSMPGFQVLYIAVKNRWLK